MFRRRSKYGNRRVSLDGITFDSVGEAGHYAELKLLEGAGEISRLETHPCYPIIINDKKVCTVELDFRYRDRTDQEHVVDFKGAVTALSNLKRKLVEACYPGLVVELVRKRRG